MLERLSNFAYRFRKSVIGFWILLLIGLTVVSSQVGSDYTDSLTLPDSESKIANTLLEDFSPASAEPAPTDSEAADTSNSTTMTSAGSSIQAVFASTDAALTEEQLADVIAEISQNEHVTSFQSPFTPGSGGISADGMIATSMVSLDVDRRESVTAIQDILDVAASYKTDTFQVAFAGNSVADAESPSSSTSSEIVGLIVAAIVLFLTFGSVVSALTPIVMAVIALGTATACISLVSNSVDISSNGPVLGALMGLSVGIDYALFIVTRFRQELAKGNNVKTSLTLAMKTSGRAVLYAGVIVSFAVLGMFAVQITVLDGLALSAFIAVLISLTAAMTLLPAFLAVLGTRINKLTLPILRNKKSSSENGVWSRIAGAVAKRPWPWLVAVSMSMLLLAAPAATIQLGQVNSGSDPVGTSTRTSYDLLTSAFGEGYLSPLTIAVEVPADARIDDIQSVADEIATDSGVDSVTTVVIDGSGELATFTVYPTTSSEDSKTGELIARLRGVTIPEAVGDSGLQVYIGGSTASTYDLASTVSSRLLAFIGAVIVLSMIFLMVLFRSISIPLKSGLMNLLSVGAAMGVVTVFFQWGWGADLIGAATGPIEPFVPILMFAILFGLSMDYEVFLVSKIREDYSTTHDNSGAVRRGLQSSAGIITAAASIMVAVFLAFLQADIRIIQELAIGLTVAILLDATLVRVLLVPALMQLLGDRNWWVPRFLDKWLPRLNIGE